MNQKSQTKKMYAHRILLESKRKERMIDFKFAEEKGLIGKMRVVKNSEEYKYLLSVCRRKFEPSPNPNSFWIEGYPIAICPIRSTEKIILIEWSLENGDFFSHAFSLADKLDECYQKLLSVLEVKSTGEQIPADILVKKCGLLVSVQLEGDGISYSLNDICSVKELNQYRLAYLEVN